MIKKLLMFCLMTSTIFAGNFIPLGVDTNLHALNRTDFSGSSISVDKLYSQSGDLYLQGMNYGHRIANAITNGQTGDVVINSLKISGSTISSTIDPSLVNMSFYGGSYFIDSILASAFGGNYNVPSIISYGQNGGDADLYRGFSHKYGPLVYQVRHDGSIMTSNNITAYGTNTASHFQTVNNSVTSVVVTSDSSVSNTVKKLWKGTASEVSVITNIEPDTIYFAEADSTVFSDTGIYHPIETYNVYPPVGPDPMTTTVSLVQEKTVYRVEVYTNCAIALDASGLNLTNREAKFELQLNIIETNIPAISFVGLEFNQTPEFTCTGCYKFACSTLDGITLQAKQIYPTVYEWRQLKYMSGGLYDAYYGFWNFTSLTTTNSIAFYNEYGEGYILVKSTFGRSGNDGTGIFTITKTHRHDAAFSSSLVENTIVLPPGSIGTSVTKLTALHYVDSDGYIGWQYWIMGTPDTIYVDQVLYLTNRYRRMNELEIKAYSQGWRP